MWHMHVIKSTILKGSETENCIPPKLEIPSTNCFYLLKFLKIFIILNIHDTKNSRCIKIHSLSTPVRV